MQAVQRSYNEMLGADEFAQGRYIAVSEQLQPMMVDAQPCFSQSVDWDGNGYWQNL